MFGLTERRLGFLDPHHHGVVVLISVRRFDCKQRSCCQFIPATGGLQRRFSVRYKCVRRTVGQTVAYSFLYFCFKFARATFGQDHFDDLRLQFLGVDAPYFTTLLIVTPTPLLVHARLRFGVNIGTLLSLLRRQAPTDVSATAVRTHRNQWKRLSMSSFGAVVGRLTACAEGTLDIAKKIDVN